MHFLSHMLTSEFEFTLHSKSLFGQVLTLSLHLSVTYTKRPVLSPITVFRLVRMTLSKGMCNVSPFAFACYAVWLVSDPVNDVESGYYMVSFRPWQASSQVVSSNPLTRTGQDLGRNDAAPRVYRGNRSHIRLGLWLRKYP